MNDIQQDIDNLKIKYKKHKKIMKDDDLTQDNSFKRVIYYISTKLADTMCF